MKRWDIKDLTLGGLFTALIAVGAFLKITIPVQPVPMHFTLQFFFVLLAALLLGSKRAFASVLTYLVIGLCGTTARGKDRDPTQSDHQISQHAGKCPF